MASILSTASVERALDAALAIPARSINDAIARLREDFPEAETEELVAYAADKFQRETTLASTAVGACAGIPALNTAGAAALSIGQTAVFLRASVIYILTVAQLRGMRVITPEKRRTLVLAALLGKDSRDILEQSLGLTTLYWATQTLADLPVSNARSINTLLAKRLAGRLGSRGAALAFGRLLPLGIGAAVGWAGGRSLARQVIDNAEVALAPAEAELPEVMDI